MAFSAQPRKPAWIMNKCLESLDYDVENQDVVFNGIVPEYEEKLDTIQEDVSALDTTVQGLDAEIDVLSASVGTLETAKEDVANKTTVINSSSTDTQYPSAKAVYIAIQGGGSTPEASNVLYDNTDSGLVADNVQDAIDEIHEEIEDIGTAVDGKLDTTTAASTYQTNANLSQSLSDDTTKYPSCNAVYTAYQALAARITALETQIIHLTPEEWEETTPVAGKIYLVDEEE